MTFRAAIRSARWTALAVALIVAMGCSEARPQRWAELLEAYPCAEEATSLLNRWRAGSEVLEAPPPPGFVERHRIATGTIGDWILLDLPPTGGPSLTRVSPDGVEGVTMTSDCAAESVAEGSATPTPADGVVVFTDEDLRRVLRLVPGAEPEPAPTVVYLWSPHMNLSVDGYGEIEAACEELGLTLVPVLLPGGDIDYAEREAIRAGIPAHGLRESASIELTLRDAHVHAPALLVFAMGRVSRVLPGYRSADGYRRFLTDFLSGSTADGSGAE